LAAALDKALAAVSAGDVTGVGKGGGVGEGIARVKVLVGPLVAVWEEALAAGMVEASWMSAKALVAVFVEALVEASRVSVKVLVGALGRR
jgi:hypothetical protein